MFQLLKKTLFVFLQASAVVDFYSFELYEEQMKEVANCGLSQKLRHESKKLQEQCVYQNYFNVCSEIFSKIGAQAKFF